MDWGVLLTLLSIDRKLKAFIWDSSRLEYEAARDCALITAGDLFGRSGYGVGLQKGSPWSDKVTLAILDFHESNACNFYWIFVTSWLKSFKLWFHPWQAAKWKTWTISGSSTVGELTAAIRMTTRRPPWDWTTCEEFSFSLGQVGKMHSFCSPFQHKSGAKEARATPLIIH